MFHDGLGNDSLGEYQPGECCPLENLEHPVHMWDCMGLDQEQETALKSLDDRDQTCESYCTTVHLYRTQVLNRVLQRSRVYLTECIYQLVLESQIPHTLVNLLFTITNSNTA